MTSRTDNLSPVGELARHRIAFRLIPYLMLLYIIAFLDRVNVNIAALEMKQDLGFTDAMYGFGAGIFFVGYFLFEIPGTLLVENWSARGWIARIMISWGILATGMGFIHTEKQFYWVRFFLGVGEAGFFPGVIVYLSHWFRYQDRAKAVALFMAAIPLSSIIGSPISGFLLGIHWLGMTGWRWLFILEGLPAIVFGVVTLFYLTDWPKEAKWLTEEQRAWITGELEREKQARTAAHSYRIWEALKDRQVVLLALAYFFVVTGTYGFNFWFPTLVKNLSGFTDFKVSVIVALTYCLTLLFMLVNGWSSDRTGERRLHAAVPITLGSLGFLLTALNLTNPSVAIAALCFTGAILYAYLPGFWPLPSSFLTGSAAAAAIGLINSIGNLGGFVGGWVLGSIKTRTNSFVGGLLYLSLSALLSVGMIMALRQKKEKATVVVEA